MKKKLLTATTAIFMIVLMLTLLALLLTGCGSAQKDDMQSNTGQNGGTLQSHTNSPSTASGVSGGNNGNYDATPNYNSGNNNNGGAGTDGLAAGSSAGISSSEAEAAANGASYDLAESRPAEEPSSTQKYEYNAPQQNEQYLEITENSAVSTSEQSMFTFSLKVDTASYSNIERYINSGSMPPASAVKVEEMINYFNYDSKMEFEKGSPFAISAEIGRSPFDAGKYLAFVRVKAKDIDRSLLPNSNLTFLIDTSGSMDSFDKLPLLKTSFTMLVQTLTKYDTVSIVTYAGSSEIVLDSVPGDQKEKILNAINNLTASGSTAGADGINTAYKLAEKNFIKDGSNRVILATDGDFNVGTSSIEELDKLIAEKRKSGVYLSILGFGTGNIRDDIMETLSKSGNGNYSYINSVSSAQKVLVDELAANLYVIADDVKAQIEFNPQNVKSYRQIGYENRRLENRDFDDDTKDAGEIGIGTDVVIMFEFEMAGGIDDAAGLKYQTAKPTEAASSKFADEIFEIRIRYKDPGQTESKLILRPVKLDRIGENNTSDFAFASTVAAFGHILRNSPYSQNISLDSLITTAEKNLGFDSNGYRYQFVALMRRVRGN